jgi:hypothetical protein
VFHYSGFKIKDKSKKIKGFLAHGLSGFLRDGTQNVFEFPGFFD